MNKKKKRTPLSELQKQVRVYAATAFALGWMLGGFIVVIAVDVLGVTQFEWLYLVTVSAGILSPFLFLGVIRLRDCHE